MYKPLSPEELLIKAKAQSISLINAQKLFPKPLKSFNRWLNADKYPLFAIKPNSNFIDLVYFTITGTIVYVSSVKSEKFSKNICWQFEKFVVNSKGQQTKPLKTQKQNVHYS